MSSGQILFSELAKGVLKSKEIVCCITRDYAKSPNCEREIIFAVNEKKPIIALMFEDVPMGELSSVGFIITPLLRIYLKSPLVEQWSVENMNEFKNALTQRMGQVGTALPQAVQVNFISSLSLNVVC